MKPLRLAIVGFGKIARDQHLPALSRNPAFEVAAVASGSADAVPGVPWCTETLSMLGSDNVGNPAEFEQLLGRKGVHYSQLVATAWR